MRELIAMTSVDVITSALGRAELPDADVLEELYLSAPVSTGLLCLRHILVETEQEANVIVDELRRSRLRRTCRRTITRRFGKHHRRSALTGTESQCLPTAQYISGFDADFVAAAFAAPATTWSQPVETQFGWHVILNRPWSEVGSDVIAPASPDGPLFYVDAVLNSADVTVDSATAVGTQLAGASSRSDDTSRNVADIGCRTDDHCRRARARQPTAHH